MGVSISPLRFSQANATASQAAVALSVLGDTGLLEVIMPWPGHIVGLSVNVENPRTAGSATIKPTVNGTQATLQAIIDATNTQQVATSQTKDTNPVTDRFAAGQRIGAKITTDGAWAAGTTPSVLATVWVTKDLSET